MLLNNTPQNEAIVSNVGEIGEFRIRNSAKAFNILSSGLYSNKIRAIIRELSCNAVDSHVAAGKKDTPFDVHLPNSMEPWFSIRDYGTGLDHNQVTQIYTTYFESTKTNSNDYIGALGLGSKSPFSYTDNFTISTVKNGIKGIYTAFINEVGVPSIALMMTEEDCTEPTGVEIKFSVNDRWDFEKFSSEAQHVYKYFKLRPANITVNDVAYVDKDIIPGVHTYQPNSYSRMSYAVMGNIAYPIEMPNADTNLGALATMLDCNLIMEFEIGDLDFQASREGLSYIPQTIASIKRKLIEIQAALATRLAEEASQYRNMWERAQFLRKQDRLQLWKSSVPKYMKDSKFPLAGDAYHLLKTFSFAVSDLRKKYNIELKMFNQAHNSKILYEHRPQHTRTMTSTDYQLVWNIAVGDVQFIQNDLKTGAVERAKFHWKTSTDRLPSEVVIINAADKTKPVEIGKFLKVLCSPLNVKLASKLMAKERVKSNVAANVTILKLVKRNDNSRQSDDLVWRASGKADSFDQKSTYYYLPIKGFEVSSILGDKFGNLKVLKEHMNACDIKSLQIEHIYGVRKADIEFIKKQSNWINLETHLQTELAKLDATALTKLAAKAMRLPYVLEASSIGQSIKALLTNQASPFIKLADQYKNTASYSFSKSSLQFLLDRYCTSSATDFNALVEQLKLELQDAMARYPMIKTVDRYSENIQDISDYINLVDAAKGV